MKLNRLSIFGLLYVLIAGCAHPISLSPEIALIASDGGANKIPASVGYYFKEDREKEVTSAGGGGDKVRYKPYKDIEIGFYKALTNVFEGVHALDSGQDTAIDRSKINYVIALDVSTNSSSSSLFTWPPTDFGVNLSCDISDNSGAKITNILAIGTGHAEYSEFSSDFSLSAKRASQDALSKLQYALLNAPEFKRADAQVSTNDNASPSNESKSGVVAPRQGVSEQSFEERLIELKRLFDEGLISDEVYQERQKAIMSTQ